MKLKKRIGAFLLAGAMMTAVGSQAFAYSWSGYLGDNRWTSVAGVKTKTSKGYATASWSGSEGQVKGCKVAIYTSDGAYIESVALTLKGGSRSITADVVSGKSYSLKGKLVKDSERGIYNSGSWNP